MLKLKRYLKPYWVLLVCAMVFLFGQAMLELTLPNMMSDIVNIGIQQGGITEVAPKAISADGMALMQAFMSEEDAATAMQQYARVEDATPYAQAYPQPAGRRLRPERERRHRCGRHRLFRAPATPVCR